MQGEKATEINLFHGSEQTYPNPLLALPPPPEPSELSRLSILLRNEKRKLVCLHWGTRVMSSPWRIGEGLDRPCRYGLRRGVGGGEVEQPRLAAHHLVLVEAPRPSHGVAAGPSAATRGRPGRRGAGGCGGLSLLLLLEVELPLAEGE